ncbi:hypothetical protein TgHK011_005481 [Trichoderma gracile]|nr:hypothetical protein TgHK011_005481 [Trichoderma gracile]
MPAIELNPLQPQRLIRGHRLHPGPRAAKLTVDRINTREPPLRMQLRFSAPNQTDRFDTHTERATEGRSNPVQSAKEVQRSIPRDRVSPGDRRYLRASDDCLLCIIIPATTSVCLLSSHLPSIYADDAERTRRSGLLHHPNPAQLWEPKRLCDG